MDTNCAAAHPVSNVTQKAGTGVECVAVQSFQHIAYLNEQVVVKSKVVSIGQGNAVQLALFKEWQGLDHQNHFSHHANRIQRDE